MSECPSDYLLYVLSGRGTMPWRSFKSAFDVVYRQAGPSERIDEQPIPKWALYNCVRVLESLGHCDFDFESGTVFVAPPVLSRLPRPGTAVAALTGSRTPELVRGLIEGAGLCDVRVLVEPPPEGVLGVPASIYLESYSADRLERLSEHIGIGLAPEPPSWELAHYAGSVEDYLPTLDWLPASDPDWSEVGYDYTTFRFAGDGSPPAKLRLSRHELHGRWTHALWRDGQRATVNLDWARYAIAKDRSQNLLAFDPKTLALGVPVAAPVPKPLSKALGLCSGHPPLQSYCPDLSIGIDVHRRFLNLFMGVPEAIAVLVADKLGQRLFIGKYKKGVMSDG